MIFAANLKCNLTRASFKNYSNTLNEMLQKKNENIFVFPPSTAFIQSEHNFIQGAQNFYPCLNGAFTGEIGKEQLDEFNIRAVLIGHSERRNLGENTEFIKEKFNFAKMQNYKIILCVGEDLKTKQENKSKDFLEKQLVNLDLDYEKLIIAYEPIYSIGSGMSANLEDIKTNLAFIKSLSKAPLLYGGSVNESNVKEILNINNCKGVLIGSYALKVENFIQIIKGQK